MNKVTIINGVKQGEYIGTLDSNNSIETGNYVNGIKNGSFKITDKDERIYQKGSYKNGILEGRFEEYYRFTVFKNIICHYENGILNGAYEKYYPRHIIEYKTKFLNGNEIGPRLNYFKNGRLGSKTYIGDGKLVKDGLFKAFDENGLIVFIGTNKNFKKNGFMEYYNRFGEVTTRYMYENDKKNGIFESYESIIHDGRNHGILRQTGNYKIDKKNGVFESYFIQGDLQGKISNKSQYIDDKLEGISIDYDKQGKIETKTTYKDGIKKGTCWEYENGKLKKETVF